MSQSRDIGYAVVSRDPEPHALSRHDTVTAGERAEGGQHQDRGLGHEATVGEPIAARATNGNGRVQVARDREEVSDGVLNSRRGLMHEVKWRLVEAGHAGVEAE
jgi:hypothetical protein